MMTCIGTTALQRTDTQRADDSREFRIQLVSSLPRLSRFARVLTRNRDQADDLVNDTMVRALRAEDKFEAGSNMNAWLCTILRNQHISNLRQHRHMTPIDEFSGDAPTMPGGQFAAVEFREAKAAMMKMAPYHRELLVMVAALGLSYEEAAEVCDCAVGTVKSRLSRARLDLQRHLSGAPETADAAAAVPPTS
jgi:RNA polymerase sigma-70 factor, ECF subfamily